MERNQYKFDTKYYKIIFKEFTFTHISNSKLWKCMYVCTISNIYTMVFPVKWLNNRT